MSRHRRRRNARLRRRRRPWLAGLATCLHWRTSFEMFPRMVHESPRLLHFARTLARAEITVREQLARTGWGRA